MICQTAFSRNGRYLTKCGRTTKERSEVTAFNPTCPACSPEAWPTRDQQKEFAK